MGLETSTDVKKELRALAKEAWHQGNVEADILIDDGTGTIYQTIASARSVADLHRLRSEFLDTAFASVLRARFYYCIMDLETYKPKNKSLLRDKKVAAPLSPEELMQHGSGLTLDATEQEFERSVSDLFAAGVRDGLCKESSNAVYYALSRVLRTHALRNEMFCAFVQGMHDHLASGKASFENVYIDGAESPDEAKKFVSTFMKVPPHLVQGEMEIIHDPITGPRTGEADLRIVEILHETFASVSSSMVCVRSKDTDLIAILLLDIVNWPEDGNVLLNMGMGRSGGPSEALNIRSLCTHLRWWAVTSYGHLWSMDQPFERVFVFVLLFGGTDFVQKPDGVGWKRLWTFFQEVGYAFFYDLDVHPPETPVDDPKFLAWERRILRALEGFVLGLLATDSRASKKYKVRHDRHVSMASDAKELFMGPEKDARKPVRKAVRKTLMKHVPVYKQLKEEVGERPATQGAIPQTKAWIRVLCRQVLWNYLYWLLRNVDPFEKKEMHGVLLPRWGWEMVDGSSRRAQDVYWFAEV